MGRDRWFLVPGRMFGWCGYIFGPVYGHILVGTKSGCAAVRIATKMVRAAGY